MQECLDCSEAVYICEGDIICSRDDVPVLVVDDWEPTENYAHCNRDKRAASKKRMLGEMP